MHSVGKRQFASAGKLGRHRQADVRRPGRLRTAPADGVDQRAAGQLGRIARFVGLGVRRGGADDGGGGLGAAHLGGAGGEEEDAVAADVAQAFDAVVQCRCRAARMRWIGGSVKPRPMAIRRSDGRVLSSTQSRHRWAASTAPVLSGTGPSMSSWRYWFCTSSAGRSRPTVQAACPGGVLAARVGAEGACPRRSGHW